MTLNVLHIVVSLNIGGLETFIIDLIRKGSGATKGHVVCLESLGNLGAIVDNIPIISLEKKPGIHFDCVRKIRTIAKEFEIDIIHTHNEGPHFYGAIAGFLCGIPVVHTRHGIHDIGSKKKMLLEKFSSLLSKKVVGVSQDVSNLYLTKLRVSPSKIITILNGIDTSSFAPRIANRQILISEKISLNAIIIGIVARLVSIKDHQTLFRACQIVAHSYSNFHLVVIGDGPEKNTLVELSKQLNLDGTIIFLGARYDIADLLNCFDIFTLSSLSEGISITLLEAMACELPVVATKVGGNPEVIQDEVTGFLVPPAKPAALAEKLLLLMRDVGCRKSMGAAGRIRILENFNIQKSVDHYEECYNQVLGRRG